MGQGGVQLGQTVEPIRTRFPSFFSRYFTRAMVLASTDVYPLTLACVCSARRWILQIELHRRPRFWCTPALLRSCRLVSRSLESSKRFCCCPRHGRSACGWSELWSRKVLPPSPLRQPWLTKSRREREERHQSHGIPSIENAEDYSTRKRDLRIADRVESSKQQQLAFELRYILIVALQLTSQESSCGLMTDVLFSNWVTAIWTHVCVSLRQCV